MKLLPQTLLGMKSYLRVIILVSEFLRLYRDKNCKTIAKSNKNITYHHKNSKFSIFMMKNYQFKKTLLTIKTFYCT